MAQDAGLAFAQNLVNRYMQFKAQQFQVELFNRREQRYERQLQENRLHRQKSLALQERSVASLEGYRNRPPQIEIFSPGQVSSLDKLAGETLEDVDVTRAGRIPGVRRLPFAGEDVVSKEEVMRQYQEYRDSVGYAGLSSDERKQADTTFDRRVSGLKAKADWRPDTDADIRTMRGKQPKLIFRGFGQRGGKEAPAFPATSGQKIGDPVTRGGRDYIITGFDSDGEPLVELVR